MTQQSDINQMSVICNKIDILDQRNIEQFEYAVCNVVNGINNTYDKKKTLKVDQSSHYFVVTAAHTEIQKADVLKGLREDHNKNQDKGYFTVT